MAAESDFVASALEIGALLLNPPLRLERGASLIYELKVSTDLEVLDADKIRSPRRGSSAFQTDLCVFEQRSAQVSIPRVVIEFKTRITTHDVLTYSAKASRHKSIYPYLRYGILASEEGRVSGRAFRHNQALDFVAAVKGLDPTTTFREFFSGLLNAELEASRVMESMAYGSVSTRLFRICPSVDPVSPASPSHLEQV